MWEGRGALSPVLVVMGDDSHSKGCGFESWRRVLDGHFFTLICSKNCIVCLKRPKINGKEARVGPFLKKKIKKIWGLVSSHLVALLEQPTGLNHFSTFHPEATRDNFFNTIPTTKLIEYCLVAEHFPMTLSTDTSSDELNDGGFRWCTRRTFII